MFFCFQRKATLCKTSSLHTVLYIESGEHARQPMRYAPERRIFWSLRHFPHSVQVAKVRRPARSHSRITTLRQKSNDLYTHGSGSTPRVTRGISSASANLILSTVSAVPDFAVTCTRTTPALRLASPEVFPQPLHTLYYQLYQRYTTASAPFTLILRLSSPKVTPRL